MTATITRCDFQEAPPLPTLPQEVMSEDLPSTPRSGVEVLQACLWQAVQDLDEGRITPTEANRITKEAGQELRRIEVLLRAAKLGHGLSQR